MASDNITVSVGRVTIDVSHPGRKAGSVPYHIPEECIDNVDGRVFIKLSKTDNVIRRLLASKCFDETTGTFPNVLPYTDVVEQLKAARSRAVIAEANLNTTKKVYRHKAFKTAMLTSSETVLVDGPSHGTVEKQCVLLKATLRGAVWMELTSGNLAYVMSIVKSQISSGGARVPKRAKHSDDNVDGDADNDGSDNDDLDGDADNATHVELVPVTDTSDVMAVSDTSGVVDAAPPPCVTDVIDCPVEAPPIPKRTLKDFFCTK